MACNRNSLLGTSVQLLHKGISSFEPYAHVFAQLGVSGACISQGIDKPANGYDTLMIQVKVFYYLPKMAAVILLI